MQANRYLLSWVNPDSFLASWVIQAFDHMLIKVFVTWRTSCILREVSICLLKIKDFNLANFYWMENEKII